MDIPGSGGRARYVNHSCEPNCYTRIIHVGGRPKVVLYSKRSMEEGEELRCDVKIYTCKYDVVLYSKRLMEEGAQSSGVICIYVLLYIHIHIYM